MPRIVTRDEVTRVVSNGNADMRVLSAVNAKDGSGKIYIVLLPLTTIRDGVFGPLGNAVGGNGKPTKFGKNLFNALLKIEGIYPSLDREFRDGIIVFVGSEVTEEPAEGFWQQSQGLPASVCYAIQEQVMRHFSRPRRLVEYVRRII